MTWPAISVLALGAFAFKALGVSWSPPRNIGRYASLIPAALFAGIIVALTFEADGRSRRRGRCRLAQTVVRRSRDPGDDRHGRCPSTGVKVSGFRGFFSAFF